MFKKYVPLDGMILDAGAGTGGVGELLHHQGFLNLVGIDISSGMLNEALKKNVYSDLRVGILGEDLDLSSDTFDAIISVGLFTLEHPPPSSSFDEIIRVTKQGGHIIFLLNNTLLNDFKRKMDEKEAEGKWEIVEISRDIFPVQKGQPHPGLKVFVYKV
jgi:SAM-dependent methyltransferase